MFELFKSWDPTLQLIALAIVVVALFAVVTVSANLFLRTLIVLKHGYPPVEPPTVFEPEPPIFKFSYNGPPEHAPDWLRPVKPETSNEPGT